VEEEQDVKSVEEKQKREEKRSVKSVEEKEKQKNVEDNWFKHYIELYVMINITNNSYSQIKTYYDGILNKDRESFKSSNDEPTPIDCVEEMIKKIPCSFWKKETKILDPVCGNGNFHFVIYNKLKKHFSPKNILENILYFNDIDENRINTVYNIYDSKNYNLNITTENFLDYNESQKFDLIVANPPYAKLLPNGKRASKNHNLIKPFIEKTLKILNPGGYLLYITPDNWMSYADRNTLIKKLTSLQIMYLNIHTAKKYFKKIGSSFTWYLIKNVPGKRKFTVEGCVNKIPYKSKVKSEIRKYIPLVYNDIVQSILHKTLDNENLEKFKVETSSDLHKYTKKHLISTEQDEEHRYKLIHTPNQTVYASRPHKYQYGYKVFISTTSYYSVGVDNCGMTQSIAFIRCGDNINKAFKIRDILQHPLYKFLNNICRWGNFNNIRILQSFPICDEVDSVWKKFNITDIEKEYIKNFI
tara:strand:- start:7183 stop:8595 length:1413 start_codon:yes stop_codon:yes gene_type:complete